MQGVQPSGGRGWVHAQHPLCVGLKDRFWGSFPSRGSVLVVCGSCSAGSISTNSVLVALCLRTGGAGQHPCSEPARAGRSWSSQSLARSCSGRLASPEGSGVSSLTVCTLKQVHLSERGSPSLSSGVPLPQAGPIADYRNKLLAPIANCFEIKLHVLL